MDSNLLISTVVTATAALIAIIGGFLVSRVITLASEQDGLKHKLRDINLDILNRTDLLEAAKLELLDSDHNNFVNEYAERLTYEDLTLEEIFEEMEDDLYRGWEIDEFKDMYVELIDIKNHLNEMITQEQIDSPKDLPIDFEDFRVETKSELRGRKSWYEIFYDIYKNRLQDSFYSIPSLLNLDTIKSKVNAYNEKVKEYDTHLNELTFLKRQKAEQQKILKEFGGNRNMWWGLWVLVYASIVGIVIPVTWGVYGNSPNKTVILCLFLSQLFFLFIYLGVSMYFLTKDEKN